MRSILVLMLAAPAMASFCDTKNGTFPVPHGAQNLYPVNELSATTYQLVKTVANGKLYNVTVPHNEGETSNFPVFHLYGTAEERGTAQGLLWKEIGIDNIIDDIWTYFKAQISSALPGWVPAWLSNLIAEQGLEKALWLTYELSKGYTTPEYYTEMQATATAAGIDFHKLRDINMIAGLTQGKCSMFGAWGNAVQGGGVLQLRALDWNMDPPIVNHPAVTVYHTKEHNTYATVGVIGLTGALTGVSDKQMGISEIGVSLPDDSFGKESRVGNPFIYVLRDVLHFDAHLEESIERMQSTKRTCDLILGVGDGKPGAGNGKPFRGFQYSSSVCTVVDDTNLIPVADWHKPIENVVYWGMDWLCPGDTQALHDQLEKHIGNLTGPAAIKDVSSVETSGDTHIAFYDLTTSEMWVSFARQSYYNGPVNAYDRQYTRFNLTTLFGEPAP